MEYSAKDCINSRVSLCKSLVSFSRIISKNIFELTVVQYSELVNVLKKTFFVLTKSHEQFFGSRGSVSKEISSRLVQLKKVFFDRRFLMSLKGQTNVKSQYNPHFDYFTLSDADCTEQFSRHPLDAFDFFQKSKTNKFSRIS